jgi:hypothetical protein
VREKDSRGRHTTSSTLPACASLVLSGPRRASTAVFRTSIGSRNRADSPTAHIRTKPAARSSQRSKQEPSTKSATRTTGSC